MVSVALPALKCCAAVLSTPPTQRGYEGSGNARDHPHTLSLQLVGEGLLLPYSDHNIGQAKITPAFAISHFKAELSAASQAVLRLGK